jgi:hypothetical protein
MIDQIKTLLRELNARKKEVTPKIEEIETKRQEQLAEVNKKYDHMIDDVKQEVKLLENKIMNDLIDVFEKAVMIEFDTKRTMSDYMVTDNFKAFRDGVSEIEMFPKDLVEHLDKVINGDPIEKIAYELEKIKNQYKIV